MKKLVITLALGLAFSTQAFANEDQEFKHELKLPVAVQSPKIGRIIIQALSLQANAQNEQEETTLIQDIQNAVGLDVILDLNNI